MELYFEPRAFPISVPCQSCGLIPLCPLSRCLNAFHNFALAVNSAEVQFWVARYHCPLINMKTINIVEGDLVVSDETCLIGVVTGGVTVTATGQLELRGVCCKNLVIEKNGRAKIFGVVSGDVANRGGELSVFGVINGRIVTDSGHSEKSPVAVVY